ncbi:general amidase [Ramaria rubella]|nr:general amidase [Ramaria rubella]
MSACSRWQDLCIDKKKRQAAAIPAEWHITIPPDEQLNVLQVPRQCGLLDANELVITEADVPELLNRLASGEWSAVEVTRAFYKRAIVAHQLTNCLTEIFVERALARATELDDHLKTTGEVKGPLHGLPISLKDQLTMKDLETVMGYASWVGELAAHDALLVTILYKLGAVPFVRTNVPQTLMFLESHNHVFGRTTNPHNRSLTPGGSSGGEGSLIALRGSPLGIATDLGGSIRVPSAFCGLYGLRPSNRRIPYRDAKGTMEGQESITSSMGPISSSLAGVKLFTKCIIDARPWKKDPCVLRMPWSESGYELADHGHGSQLCFGLLWDDGYTVPHPPIRRALEITMKAVLKAGHKVIRWEPHKHLEIVANAVSIYFAGGEEDLAATVGKSGESLIRTMRPEFKVDTDRLPPYWPELPSLSAYELWECHKVRRDLRQAYLDHWEASVATTGTGRPVDAIIAPVAPYAAAPHGDSRNTMYTVVWSSLDYPSLVLPVTTVDPKLDAIIARDDFLSTDDQILHELYTPETYKHAPVGLQLVARTHEDEALIRMSEIVDQALKTASARN